MSRSQRARHNREEQAATSSGTQQLSSASATQSSGRSPLDFAKYGPFHKAIVAAIMSKNCLSALETRDLFIHTCQAFEHRFPTDPAGYYEMVGVTMGAVNARLKKYRLAVKKVASDKTLDSFYVLVNQSNHDVHKEQEFFSAVELEYLHELMNRILDAPERALSAHQVYDIKVASKNISSSVAEAILTKLINLRFVIRDEDSARLTLGPRGVAELEPHIKERNPDLVQNCMFCQTIVLESGVSCARCNKRVHPACLIRAVDPGQPTADISCVGCREPFLDAVVGRYRKLGKEKCQQFEQLRETQRERQEKVQSLAAV